jgi:hypothetical protein
MITNVVAIVVILVAMAQIVAAIWVLRSVAAARASADNLLHSFQANNHKMTRLLDENDTLKKRIARLELLV